MSKVKDSVFGWMEYDYNWETYEDQYFWDRLLEVKIVVKSYNEEPISDIQREAYKKYKSNLAMYNKEIPSVLLSYYLENYEYISETICPPEKYDNEHINQKLIVNLIRVRTIYFDKDGKYGYLCDCAWDKEHGIGILLSEEHPKVIMQDELI